MVIDPNLGPYEDMAFWCPLCSLSWLAPAERGPFWFVRGIPLERVVTAQVKADPSNGSACSYWVCERCCKREGLVW